MVKGYLQRGIIEFRERLIFKSKLHIVEHTNQLQMGADKSRIGVAILANKMHDFGKESLGNTEMTRSSLLILMAACY